jgi:uncharacterized protein
LGNSCFPDDRPDDAEPRLERPLFDRKGGATIPRLDIVVHHGAWPRVDEIVGVAFRYPNVMLVPDMYIFQPGGRLYVEAANGALADQVAFGSSYPFRAMRQSADDYQRLGFRDEVLEKVLFANAARLLKMT